MCWGISKRMEESFYSNITNADLKSISSKFTVFFATMKFTTIVLTEYAQIS